MRMHRVNQVTRRKIHVPCNKRKLMERLRRDHPEIFPITNGRFHHQEGCPSIRYFVSCTCPVQLFVTVAGKETIFS